MIDNSEAFHEPRMNKNIGKASLKLLRTIHQTIRNMKDEQIKGSLPEELIFRLDHVTHGCSCEYPRHFKRALGEVYTEFRLRFDLERKPRKSAYIS